MGTQSTRPYRNKVNPSLFLQVNPSPRVNECINDICDIFMSVKRRDTLRLHTRKYIRYFTKKPRGPNWGIP